MKITDIQVHNHMYMAGEIWRVSWTERLDDDGKTVVMKRLMAGEPVAVIVQGTARRERAHEFDSATQAESFANSLKFVAGQQ